MAIREIERSMLNMSRKYLKSQTRDLREDKSLKMRKRIICEEANKL